MATIKIYGSSDDVVIVDGDNGMSDEYYPGSGGYGKPSPMHYFSFNDGTLLSVVYDKDGIWRINCLSHGNSEYSKEDGTDDEGTDTVTLVGDINWVLFGDKYDKASKK